MASQPTMTIDERLSAGWGLCKRGWELCKRHPILSFLPSVVGAFIYIPLPFLFFAAPLYAVACYMTSKIETWREATDSRYFQGASPVLGARYCYGYS